MTKAVGFGNRFKLFMFGFTDKLADLKFFIKKNTAGASVNDKLEHAIHEMNYCNEKAKIYEQIPFALPECQQALKELKDIASDVYNSDNPLSSYIEYMEQIHKMDL